MDLVVTGQITGHSDNRAKFPHAPRFVVSEPLGLLLRNDLDQARGFSNRGQFIVDWKPIGNLTPKWVIS